MNMELKDNKKIIKKITARSLINTIKYSIEGLIYFYRSEKSAIIHFVSVLIAIILGIVLKITLIEGLILTIFLTLILSVELLNSAIESVCDLVSLEYQPLIKVAKDCGSAATFVLSSMTFIVGKIIFIPNLIEMLF